MKQCKMRKAPNCLVNSV